MNNPKTFEEIITDLRDKTTNQATFIRYMQAWYRVYFSCNAPPEPTKEQWQELNKEASKRWGWRNKDRIRNRINQWRRGRPWLEVTP
jgi:hypothetical protein